jgi:hypothetical protein
MRRLLPVCRFSNLPMVLVLHMKQCTLNLIQKFGAQLSDFEMSSENENFSWKSAREEMKPFMDPCSYLIIVCLSEWFSESTPISLLCRHDHHVFSGRQRIAVWRKERLHYHPSPQTRRKRSQLIEMPIQSETSAAFQRAYIWSERSLRSLGHRIPYPRWLTRLKDDSKLFERKSVFPPHIYQTAKSFGTYTLRRQMTSLAASASLFSSLRTSASPKYQSLTDSSLSQLQLAVHNSHG